MVGSARSVHAQGAVEPYVLVVVDNSGSMNDPAGGGVGATRMEAAIAALANVFAGVGEITFALQSFIVESTCTGACSCNNGRVTLGP